jgi:hypothetical protein
MNTSHQKSGTTGAKMSDKKADSKSTASRGTTKSTDGKKSSSTKKN